MNNTNANDSFEKKVGKVVEDLRFGSMHIEPSEVREHIIGLILLRYMSVSYEESCKDTDNKGEGDDSNQGVYINNNTIFVPESATWREIVSNVRYIQPNEAVDKIGELIDDAMSEIAKENNELTDILPQDYSKLNKKALYNLVKILTDDIDMNDIGGSKDMLAQLCEYFIDGKIFEKYRTSIPVSVSKTLVSILRPYYGCSVYDCCCGFGEMFVQSARYIQEHDVQGHGTIQAYGLELDENAYKIAKMNMIIHSIDADIKNKNAFEDNTFASDKFRYILAFPPIKSRDYPLDVWIDHMLGRLEDNGKIGVVIPNSVLDSIIYKECRKKIIEEYYVEGVIAMPQVLFQTATFVSILIITKEKKDREKKTLFVDARNMGEKDRFRKVVFSQDDIDKLSATFEKFRDNKLKDVKEFCAVVSDEDIIKYGYSLTPECYIKTRQGELIKSLISDEWNVINSYPDEDNSFYFDYLVRDKDMNPVGAVKLSLNEDRSFPQKEILKGMDKYRLKFVIIKIKNYIYIMCKDGEKSLKFIDIEDLPNQDSYEDKLKCEGIGYDEVISRRKRKKTDIPVSPLNDLFNIEEIYGSVSEISEDQFLSLYREVKEKGNTTEFNKGSLMNIIAKVLSVLLLILLCVYIKTFNGASPDDNFLGNDSAMNIYIGMLSFVFVVTSLVTILSDKTDIIYWTTVVDYQLVNPKFFGMRNIVFYLFIVSIAGFCMVLKCPEWIIICLAATTLLLFCLTFKMIDGFIDRRGIKDELICEFVCQNLKEYIKMIYSKDSEKEGKKERSDDTKGRREKGDDTKINNIEMISNIINNKEEKDIEYDKIFEFYNDIDERNKKKIKSKVKNLLNQRENVNINEKGKLYIELKHGLIENIFTELENNDIKRLVESFELLYIVNEDEDINRLLLMVASEKVYLYVQLFKALLFTDINYEHLLKTSEESTEQFLRICREMNNNGLSDDLYQIYKEKFIKEGYLFKTNDDNSNIDLLIMLYKRIVMFGNNKEQENGK